jgi:hypothetical protein
MLSLASTWDVRSDRDIPLSDQTGQDTVSCRWPKKYIKKVKSIKGPHEINDLVVDQR